MRSVRLIVAFAFPAILGLLMDSRPFRWFLGTEYSPRRDVYMKHPWFLWTNVASDVLIAFSFFLFSLCLFRLVRRLRHIAYLDCYKWTITAFMVFVLASGTTHFLRVITIWIPLYQFSTTLKIVCAAAIIPSVGLFAAHTPGMMAGIERFFDLLSINQRQADRLRKSEEFLDRTGRIAGIGGWEIDLLTNEVTWSAETYHIHGAPPEYCPTLAAGLSFYTPESKPVIVAAIEKACAEGKGWDLELQVQRLDGRTIWVRIVGTVEFRDGKPIRLSGAFQNITARVQAREELRLANECVTLATDSGRIGIFDWNAEEDICVCDAWMYRLHDLEQVSATTPLDFWVQNIHPQDRAPVTDALLDAVAGTKPYDTEYRVIWKDSSVHHLRAAAQITRDQAGRAVRLVDANWDVTESRRLTAQLAEQHEVLQVTLNSICDGVITVNAQRNVIWLNPVAERMTGWSSGEAAGQPLTSVFRTLNEETRSDAENPLANSLVQGKTVGLARHTLLISREGSECSIENSAAPLCDAQGEILGNVLIFRDVTEQRRFAAESEHVTKLQLQLKFKDEFLSHVSHELRSPLTSIYSFASIIADDLAGETTPEQQEYLEIILKNVQQLQAMIEDLLTVTQSKEGKLSIDLQRVAVYDAVDDALHIVQGAAASKNIVLSSDDCRNLPAAVADPTRLRQILIILLDNAIKFTPSAGKVTICVRLKDPGLLQFQVVDTGCGIPQEKWALVFENLYQITSSSHPDTSQAGRIGLGLGLHIARNLVTRQSGCIWVTSAPDQGSIFNFTLPVFSEQHTRTHSVSVEGSSHRKNTDWPNSDISVHLSAPEKPTSDLLGF